MIMRLLSKMPRIVTALSAAILMLCTSSLHAEELTLPLADLEAKATTYFVSPAGQGQKDGSSESNALSFENIKEFIRELKASAKLVLLPGTYNLTQAWQLRSPSANDVLVVEGRDNAVIRGSFNFENETGTGSGIRLHSGNIIVRGLDFEDVGFCVKPNKASHVNQVLIENIDARNVHSCVLIDRDGLLPVTRWIVRDSRIKGYYRVGVRLAGHNSSDFLLDGLHIDGAHDRGKSECFKGGIQLLAGVSNVHIRNTTIENNIGTCGEGYQQGDGIEADHKDGTPKNIRIDKVRISNSGDSELDLKADQVTMSNVVALGGELTRFAYKMWGYPNYQCSNCYAHGPHQGYIFLSQASATFRDSFFANSGPVHPCDLRHGTTPEQQSAVRFENVQLYLANEEWINDCGAGALAGVKRLEQGKIAPPAPVTNVQAR